MAFCRWAWPALDLPAASDSDLCSCGFDRPGLGTELGRIEPCCHDHSFGRCSDFDSLLGRNSVVIAVVVELDV